MVAVPDRLYMTPEEYLNWEEHQELKYEYINGQAFCMTGGTVNHGTIAANLFYQLKGHLQGSACRAFVFDVKLGVSEKGPFHYPDIMVSCDERDRNAKKVIYHPCVIIEVLSPSTEAFDRGKKFQHYRQIQTLKEYVLISAGQKNIECFRLNDRGFWELHIYTEADEIELTSVNFHCSFDLIYEDLVLGED